MTQEEEDPLARAQARCDPNSGTFSKISWSEVKTIVASNDLSKLTRSPNQLLAYQRWKSQTLLHFESIEQFILHERLHWTLPIVPNSDTVFQDRSDWKCLPNDFPYGLEDNIKHLVIWLKPKLPITPDGELTGDALKSVDRFVKEMFGSGQDVLYFMNTAGLKSIGNLEHFHVLLRNRKDVAQYYDEE